MPSSRSIWVAYLVEFPALGFSSGRDHMVMISQLWAQALHQLHTPPHSTQSLPKTLFSLSPCLTPHAWAYVHALALLLSNQSIFKKMPSSKTSLSPQIIRGDLSNWIGVTLSADWSACWPEIGIWNQPCPEHNASRESQAAFVHRPHSLILMSNESAIPTLLRRLI